MSKTPKMSNHRALSIAEGMLDASEDEQREAWGHLLRSGMLHTLPGHFGRHAQRLLDAGLI